MREFVYYDCHMHALGEQKGGILIALDGRRGSEGGYSNSDVINIAKSAENVFPAQYITYEFQDDICTEIIKYHPRRELYTYEEVCNDIATKRGTSKLIVVDTLNQPNWQPNDYWELARQFPDKQFLMSHTGGLDILQFINMAMYQPNVWIDFSFIQHIFGWSSQSQTMPVICQTIDYMLDNERLKHKILFGSDNMTNEEDHAYEALKKYKEFDSFAAVTVSNYLNMIERSNITKDGVVG